jgi:hypothetical protein
MNDREFIELLNLYLDREISPEDSLRLEAEVLSRPDRRQVYDEYCRMQKACSMLAEETADAPVASIPARRAPSWGLGPMVAGLAAACLIVVVGLRIERGSNPVHSGIAVDQPNTGASIASSPAPARQADSMEAVFQTRLQAPANRVSASGVFVSFDPVQSDSQLNWIGSVRLAPVASVTNPDFRLAPRQDLKGAVLSDAHGEHDSELPGEMTAFRFQR